MYRIKLATFAENDIRESIRWYNDASGGLGRIFYRSVKDAISLIQRNPKHFPVRYKTIHTVLVKKFPFLIHYQIDEKSKVITILGVIHTSRNPEIWDERSE